MTDRDAPGATVPPRDPVIRFRLHRGSLAASMETMRTFRSRVEFLHALREEMGLWASSSDEEFARNLGFVLYGDGPDTRIGWERTYLVTLSGSPIGFADGVPGDLPETSQPPGPAGTPCPTCGRDDVFMKGDSWWCSNCGKARPSPSDQARAERRRAAAPVEAPPILSRPEIQLPTDLQRTPDQEAFLRGARDAEGTTPEGRVVKKALDRMWDAPPIEPSVPNALPHPEIGEPKK